MNNNLFPNIKGALRGKLSEEDTIPRTNNSMGTGNTTPHNNAPQSPSNDPNQQRYEIEKKKLDDQESSLRSSLERVSQARDNLNKKYNKQSVSEDLHYSEMAW
jgi:hypothetical protein